MIHGSESLGDGSSGKGLTEIEELQLDIENGRRVLADLDYAMLTLTVRVYAQFIVVIVLGTVVVLGAIWHFKFGFWPRRDDYEAVIGAASIFGLFFFYETTASAVSAFTRWQVGRRIQRAQYRALEEAEDVIGSAL